MKRHICYVLPPFERYSPVSGGALATVTLNHARELLARGHRVSVVAPDFDGEKYDVGEVQWVKVKHREDLHIARRFISSKVRGRAKKYDLPYFEYYLRAIIPALKKLQPDVTLIFNDFSAPIEIKAALPQTHLVSYLQNEHHSRQAPQYLDANLDALDQIWGVSDYISEHTKTTYARARDKVSTLYNGVDTDTFAPRPNYLEEPKEDEPVRVVFVGRVDPTKGGDLVARAVAQLKSEGLAVELSVAGAIWFYNFDRQNDDPYFRELRELLDEAGANYLGHVARPDIPATFAACDIACAPSRFNEPFGLVALEGMASGCALIAATRGGLAEFCPGAALMIDPDLPDANQSGGFTDANQSGGFTDALRQLVTNRALLRDYKARGRARALEYRWSVAADRVEALLERLGA